MRQGASSLNPGATGQKRETLERSIMGEAAQDKLKRKRVAIGEYTQMCAGANVIVNRQRAVLPHTKRTGRKK